MCDVTKSKNAENTLVIIRQVPESKDKSPRLKVDYRIASAFSDIVSGIDGLDVILSDKIEFSN